MVYGVIWCNVKCDLSLNKKKVWSWPTRNEVKHHQSLSLHLSLSPSPSLSLSLTPSPSLSLSLSYTHTHTHTHTRARARMHAARTYSCTEKERGVICVFSQYRILNWTSATDFVHTRKEGSIMQTGISPLVRKRLIGRKAVRGWVENRGLGVGVGGWGYQFYICRLPQTSAKTRGRRTAVEFHQGSRERGVTCRVKWFYFNQSTVEYIQHGCFKMFSEYLEVFNYYFRCSVNSLKPCVPYLGRSVVLLRISVFEERYAHSLF